MFSSQRNEALFGYESRADLIASFVRVDNSRGSFAR